MTTPKLYGGHTLAEIKEWTRCALSGEGDPHPTVQAMSQKDISVMFCDLLSAADEGEQLRAENEGLANLIWEHKTAPADAESVHGSMDRVKKLHAQNERLREALKDLLNHGNVWFDENGNEHIHEADPDKAHRALDEV